ncbi:ribosome biogenesis GTPase YlqF [Desulforudis sp. 1088]|uniref:ribosome biogenesis GTPase YlqF n=2 Tax=Candidatus Desulforudis TaxID=471826 RepID=UPI003CE5353F
MPVQWFPGHMAKARRQIKSQLKICDLVIELLDARIPRSSRNPSIDELLGAKPRVVVLNKVDLADAAMTRRWEKILAAGGDPVIQADSVKGAGIRSVVEAILSIPQERLKRRPGGSLRAVVVGIPNVGKSSFINRLVGQRAARTGRRPGLTRGPQWIRIGGDVELLDTPGILWPKFDDPLVGLKLAATGAIKEEVFSCEEIAGWLLGWLAEKAPAALAQRYDLPSAPADTAEVLGAVGLKRGVLLPGGRVDLERAAALIIKDFQDGRLGRFTLDDPAMDERRGGD